MPELTVYFDGSCPLCAREIAFYRRCRGGDRLDWVDVSELPDGEIAAGLSKSAALRRFHVKEPDGRILSGGLAFAHLWSALSALRPIGRISRIPPLAWLLELGYRLFLKLRPLLQRLVVRRESACPNVNK